MEQRRQWVLTNMMRSYGGRNSSMSCDSFFMFVVGSIGNFLEWFASLTLPGQTKLNVSVTSKTRAMSSIVFVWREDIREMSPKVLFMVNQRTRVLHNWNSDVLCTLLRRRELDESLEVYMYWTHTRLIRIQHTHILRLFLWIRLILSFGRILVSIGCAILYTNTMNCEVLLLLVRSIVDCVGKVTIIVSANLLRDKLNIHA